MDEAQRLLVYPDLTTRERGRTFRLLGRARSESGDPYGGMKALELSIPLALRAKDWDCLGKARAELGISWFTVGDVPNAIDCFEAYLLDLQRYDSAKAYLGNVLYNLGLAYRRRKDIPRAVEYYQAAVGWFTERGYILQAGETHQNLAWLHCTQGNTEDAAMEIELAESFSHVCSAEFRVEQLLCRAFLHMVQKDIVTAMRLTNEVLQEGRQGCTTTQKATACWIAGSCSVAMYNFETAQFFAEAATHYALSAKDPASMSLASNLKAEIARRRQGTDEAVG